MISPRQTAPPREGFVASLRALLSGVVFCVCAALVTPAQADIVYEFSGTCLRVGDSFGESGSREPPCSALTTPIATAVLRMPNDYVPGQAFSSEFGPNSL